MIPFGEFLPDLPDIENPGATVAKNVIPALRSYRPLPGLSVVSNALDSRCLGGAAAQDAGGNVVLFAGDNAKLYKLGGTTFADVSKAGGYSTGTDGNWEFDLFDDRLVATNYSDAVQSWTIGTSSKFADLITSTLKPKARTMATVRQFLVLGNTLDGTDGAKPSRVWWSAFNDPTDFDPDADTQCDYEDISVGGWVQRIVGGFDYALIFMESQIYRMTYVGPPVVFRIDAIDKKRGTPFPGSVVGYGRHVYFWSDEGIFVNDGVQSHPIGANKVDQFLWADLDTQSGARITAAVDPKNKLVIWAYPTLSSGTEVAKVLIYNWVNNRFSYGEISLQVMTQLLVPGLTLEDLDDISASIDDLPFSLDSRAWTGGFLRFAAFNTDNKLCYFEGDNLEAVIETTEAQVFPGRRAFVDVVWPFVDGTPDATITIGTRDRQGDSVSWGSATSIEAEGHAPVETEGRYHRARVTVPAAEIWDHAVGIDVEARPVGKF